MIFLTTLIRPPATFSHPMGEGMFYGAFFPGWRLRCRLTPGYYLSPFQSFNLRNLRNLCEESRR